MSVIQDRDTLYEFAAAAMARFGDPARAMSLLLIEFGDAEPRTGLGALWSIPAAELELYLGGVEPVRIPAGMGEPEFEDGDLARFQVRKICAGVWTLAPSLNIPGVLHAFVVLYGVPEPAPWERLVILAGDAGWAGGF